VHAVPSPCCALCPWGRACRRLKAIFRSPDGVFLERGLSGSASFPSPFFLFFDPSSLERAYDAFTRNGGLLPLPSSRVLV